MSKTLLMLVGDYAEDYETMVPFQTLLAVGHVSMPYAPTKRPATPSPRPSTISRARRPIAKNGAITSRSTTTSPRSSRRTTTAWSSPAARARVPAPERQGAGNRAPFRCGAQTDRRRLPCAQLLAAADILKGRTCSAYPACAPEVRLAGGTYAEIAIDQAHTDGNLVTAPAWPAHPAWLAQFLAVLGTRISH